MAYATGIQYVYWFKDRLIFNPAEYDANITDDGTFIYFKKVNFNAAGLYSCAVQFKNGQYMVSTNEVLVKVIRNLSVRCGF